MDELYVLNPLIYTKSTPNGSSQYTHGFGVIFGNQSMVSLFAYFAYYEQKTDGDTFFKTEDKELERKRNTLTFELIKHAQVGTLEHRDATKDENFIKLIDSDRLFSGPEEFAFYVGKYLSHEQTISFILNNRLGSRYMTDASIHNPITNKCTSRSLGGKSSTFYQSCDGRFTFWNLPSYVGQLAYIMASIETHANQFDDANDELKRENLDTLIDVERMLNYEGDTITQVRVIAHFLAVPQKSKIPPLSIKEGTIEYKWIGKLLYYHDDQVDFADYCEQIVRDLSRYVDTEKKRELDLELSKITSDVTDWWAQL